MWTPGIQPVQIYKDFNQEFLNLQGNLDDLTARIMLATFLQRNLGFTFELMSGMRLLLIQEIMLKSLFLRENALIVAGRGLGKSTIIAMFCCLYPIFFPGTSICLISANFRGARRIFDAAEKMVKGPYAHLLSECFPKSPQRLPDVISWKLENRSEIFALPLSNGEGLRGTRASVVFVDEGLLISEDIQKNVIRPFLTAKQNFLEETEIKEREDELIAAGVITETDRISFPKNKYLVCSSASYDFEYLHRMYNDYIDIATNPNRVKKKTDDEQLDGRYVVIRASYESLPSKANGQEEESFLDLSQIESAKEEGGEESDYFKREYRALFSAGSTSYFSPQKMAECTVKDGNNPTIQVVGRPDEKYVLTIDPSYAANKSSDFFGMGVYQLMPEMRNMVLVNSYGQAGGELLQHFKYLVYILKKFNIVWISIDASGTEFIDSFNQSTIAKENNLKLDYLTANLEADDYLPEIAKLKIEYNQTAGRIVYPMKFTGDNIRRMNEYLQAGIHGKKVWFASRLEFDEAQFKKVIQNIPMPVELKTRDNTLMDLEEFIYEQDEWITRTKNQCALIEVKSTPMGTLQYDLPSNVAKSKANDRPRKDNYTCLLMGYTASKYYYDMVFTDIPVVQSTFSPFTV